MRSDKIEDFKDWRIVESISDFLISIPTKSLEREAWILSTTSKATLFSSNIISKSWKISSNCSFVRVDVKSLDFNLAKNPGCSF